MHITLFRANLLQSPVCYDLLMHVQKIMLFPHCNHLSLKSQHAETQWFYQRDEVNSE